MNSMHKRMLSANYASLNRTTHVQNTVYTAHTNNTWCRRVKKKINNRNNVWIFLRFDWNDFIIAHLINLIFFVCFIILIIPFDNIEKWWLGLIQRYTRHINKIMWTLDCFGKFYLFTVIVGSYFIVFKFLFNFVCTFWPNSIE